MRIEKNQKRVEEVVENISGEKETSFVEKSKDDVNVEDSNEGQSKNEDLVDKDNNLGLFSYEMVSEKNNVQLTESNFQTETEIEMVDLSDDDFVEKN